MPQTRILVEIVCDFVHAISVIPLDENCPKCACRIDGHCIRARQNVDTVHCDYGRKGYYSLQAKGMREVTA